MSRQVLIDSRFQTVICAPIHSAHDGLATQVQVGFDDGLTHVSSIPYDEIVSHPKSMLKNFIGSLSRDRMQNLANALRIALDIP